MSEASDIDGIRVGKGERWTGKPFITASSYDDTMGDGDIILEATKKAGEPPGTGKVAEPTGPDRKAADRESAEMEKDGKIVSPVRRKREPAGKRFGISRNPLPHLFPRYPAPAGPTPQRRYRLPAAEPIYDVDHLYAAIRAEPETVHREDGLAVIIVHPFQRPQLPPPGLVGHHGSFVWAGLAKLLLQLDG